MFLLSDNVIIDTVNYPNNESFCFLFSTTAPTHTNSAVFHHFRLPKDINNLLVKQLSMVKCLNSNINTQFQQNPQFCIFFWKFYFDDNLLPFSLMHFRCWNCCNSAVLKLHAKVNLSEKSGTISIFSFFILMKNQGYINNKITSYDSQNLIKFNFCMQFAHQNGRAASS